MANTIEEAIAEFERLQEEYVRLLNPFEVGSYSEPSPLAKMMQSEEIANKMLPKLRTLLSQTKAMFKNAFLVLNRLVTDGIIPNEICQILVNLLRAVGIPLVRAIEELIAAIDNQQGAYRFF